jgi:hypothetical protein
MLRVADGTPFAVGRSRYDDHNPQGPAGAAKIHVKIEVKSIGLMLAQLDTGAEYSVLDAEVAEALDLFDGEGTEIAMRAADGGLAIRGRLKRVSLVVIADEKQGESLTLDATFLVSPEWKRRTFLGYTGLLQHIRFGIDPHDNWFYFGP